MADDNDRQGWPMFFSVLTFLLGVWEIVISTHWFNRSALFGDHSFLRTSLLNPQFAVYHLQDFFHNPVQFLSYHLLDNVIDMLLFGILCVVGTIIAWIKTHGYRNGRLRRLSRGNRLAAYLCAFPGLLVAGPLAILVIVGIAVLWIGGSAAGSAVKAEAGSIQREGAQARTRQAVEQGVDEALRRRGL